MLKVDNPYEDLLVAILKQAINDYKRSAKNIIKIYEKYGVQKLLEKRNNIFEYQECKRHFLNSCNEIIDMDGEDILSGVNKTYKVDMERVEEIIQIVEGKTNE